jgi:hypothetical protein
VWVIRGLLQFEFSEDDPGLGFAIDAVVEPVD